MTLIYARRLQDLVFFLADTFSENALTNEVEFGFSNPLIKVVSLQDRFVVAYAGNSSSAEKCFAEILKNEPGRAIDSLLMSHIQSQKDGSEVEYIVCDIAISSLDFVKGGKRVASNLGYVGSQSAFERFQQYQNSDVARDFIIESHMLRLVDGISNESNSIYSKAHSSFERTVLDGRGDCGGFVMSYLISKAQIGYGTYASVYRAPLEKTEVVENRWVTVPHEDGVGGGYRLEAWGGRRSFAAYFPSGRLGHIFSGFENDKLSCQTYRNIDGYDFVEQASVDGCGVGGVATWRDWRNDFWKARQLIAESKLDRARVLIDAGIVTANKALAALNPGWEPDFSKGIIDVLMKRGGFKIHFETVNMIVSLLDVQVAYFEKSNDELERGKVLKELAVWRSWIKEMVIDCRFS